MKALSLGLVKGEGYRIWLCLESLTTFLLIVHVGEFLWCIWIQLRKKAKGNFKKIYSFYQFLWFVSLSALHLGRSFTFVMNHIVRLLFLALLNFIGRTHGLLPLVCEGLFVLKFLTLILVCPFDQLRVSIKPS